MQLLAIPNSLVAYYPHGAPEVQSSHDICSTCLALFLLIYSYFRNLNCFRSYGSKYIYKVRIKTYKEID